MATNFVSMLTPPATSEDEENFPAHKTIGHIKELLAAFADLDDMEVGLCDVDTIKYVLRCFRLGLFDFELPVVMNWIKSYIKGDQVSYRIIVPILADRLKDRLWGNGAYLAQPKKNPNTDYIKCRRKRLLV